MLEMAVKERMEQELKINKYGIFLPKEDWTVRMVSREFISKNIRKYNGLNLVFADIRKICTYSSTMPTVQGSDNNVREFNGID